jgi:DNA-binding MarR family transcriptional regulator
MKQFVWDTANTESATGTIHDSVAVAGATVKSFLDAADRLHNRISTALKSAGLTWPQFEVLDQLRHAPGKSLPLRVLADCQSCAASNITQLVDRLEREGYVKRVDDPEDRRSVRAELTPEGRQAAINGEAQIESVREYYRTKFTEEERLELGRLVAKID